MQWRVAVAMLVVLGVSGCAILPWNREKPLLIAEKGPARVQIVVAEAASPATRYAAEELQRFLGEITGADIPIVTDDAPLGAHEIILGKNAHLFPADVFIDFDALGKEGYVIRTAGPHLVIAGGEPRGTLYGVYGFLEDHLGCRWFTPDVYTVPKRPTLKAGPFDETTIPILEYREPFTKDCFDGDWAARNRMNSSAASLEERHGGKVTYHGFVHTFDQLVPPDKYFDEHPEYFSEIKGERIKDHTQLCCTNEEVIQIITLEIQRRMREHPEATVFSVSQNDWGNYCQCARCAALAEAEDSQIAPVLQLVNRVADAVRDEFPDKAIDTLAYQWTRKPPKTMRPAPNVIIRLCSIECCFSHSFEKCSSIVNVDFVRDVKGWSTMCDRLWVWDYVTSFSHYLVPFPNLHVRGDNIRFLIKHNVRGIFEQDVYTTLNGELSGLSGYLNAKLLWNPKYDEDKAINEFLAGVYGAAAKPIRKYLDLIHDRVEKKNIHMDIWIGPNHNHLTDELLATADALWDAAERAVAGDAAVLERVRTARLSVDYAIIERTRAKRDACYIMDHDNFAVRLDPVFSNRIKRFFEVAERNQVTAIRESNGGMDVYRNEVGVLEPEQRFEPRPADAAAGMKEGLRYRYFEGEWNMLPDFATLTPVKAGIAEKVSLDIAPKQESYALEFTGYFLAPKDGVYSFSLTSNDGSRLFLGDAELVNNDGLHKAETRSGIIALRAGLHPITVTFFQSGGAQALALHCAGPDMPHQPVPLSSLRHAP